MQLLGHFSLPVPYTLPKINFVPDEVVDLQYSLNDCEEASRLLEMPTLTH